MFSFGLTDLIDILLVSFLLYYIYSLMRETRSANVFSGIIIFVMVWLLVTHVFNMRLLGGIMDQLMNIGVLAIVIIFQEEIRNFFSTIGKRRFFSTFSRMFRHGDKQSPGSEVIMPIVMACLSMSKQKVGALIVIERGVSLSDEIKTGEVINANVNQRLIENIFFKNSPLHDGALVDEDVAAGGNGVLARLLKRVAGSGVDELVVVDRQQLEDARGDVGVGGLDERLGAARARGALHPDDRLELALRLADDVIESLSNLRRSRLGQTNHGGDASAVLQERAAGDPVRVQGRRELAVGRDLFCCHSSTSLSSSTCTPMWKPA